MGIIGLAIWCRSLEPQNLIKIVTEYTMLIHSNEVVSMANCFYCLVVQYLLQNIEDPQRGRKSFQYAKGFNLGKNQNFKEWIVLIEKTFEDRSTLEKELPVYKASGWVRIGLTYAIHFLVSGKSYEQSLKWIVSQKGDPDTNGCIMGGLLGVYYGVDKLGMDVQIEKIGKWHSSYRPQWLNPGKVIPKFVEMLL